MRTSDIKPYVHINEANANPVHVAEICAGLEEEGIPYAVFAAQGDAKPLALNAANHSKLRVGIGITARLAVLQTRNCPIDIPPGEITGNDPILHVNLLCPTAASKCRALGTNAARLVKGNILV
ncbi:MAG: glycerol dehydratase reactivase beta/small subunit family protein [Defluviitaleaceae bacterium]|nr:glycerol dehydratase reactivase beta/small subunit family protein [Defluviitaleaceae bacterium]